MLALIPSLDFCIIKFAYREFIITYLLREREELEAINQEARKLVRKLIWVPTSFLHEYHHICSFSAWPAYCTVYKAFRLYV